MSDTASEIDDLPLDIEDNEDDEQEEEGGYEFEEQPSIYFSEDFISGPFLSEDSTVPGNILEFDYSFGYDCKKFYNLAVADENTLVFGSGNLINFFNVETREFWFRRSAFGGGIGHIAKNPNPDYPHIAVGENGTRPPIIVYDWPSLEIVCLLKQGTAKTFTHLSYSPDGLLLVSQGGPPDYSITVFDWVKSKVLLRTKSNVNPVYRAMFSPHVPGQLTSCGLTHIKFWKMAETFTGLKLQGELGRFGKTEYCDILGIYPMADEKVISGSEWGNILIWDEGLIKIEVTRKLNRKCHDAPITQFYFSRGQLWSVGMDGHVRVWFYETIDTADPPDDSRYIAVEPIYDFYVPGVQYMCIHKRNNDPEDRWHFAQDGNGGLFRIDLDVQIDDPQHEHLYKCHAGAVVDIAPCPWGPYLATLGIDGRLQLYHYVDQKLLFIHQYPAKGAAMIWLPLKVQPSGDQIIMGFDDGNLRVVVLKASDKPDAISVTTIQITKPHNRPITKMTLNETGKVLVTGGEDATVFIYQVKKEAGEYTVLIPIGYLPVPGSVTWLSWHHKKHTAILVGCIHGHIVQAKVPTVPQDYTTITYILKLRPKHQRFTTYKAQIRRNIVIAQIEARKAIKMEKKRQELNKIKADNPGLDIDEEVFLADSESEEELEPLHIPEIPNRVLWLQSTDDGTIWVSMAGYDAGYIYEYYMDQKIEIPSLYQMVFHGDDTEINNYIYTNRKDYIIFAMQNGSLRVVKVNQDDWRDLSDYWQLSMHDNNNGFIPRMCFSHDERYFFTCGHDGNIFSYKFYPEDDEYFVKPDKKTPIKKTPIEVVDKNGYKNLSLEEQIVKAEYDRIQRFANRRKRKLLMELHGLRVRFQGLLRRNHRLPRSQHIPKSELVLDPRITEDLEQKLSSKLALVKRKLEFKVERSRIAMEKLRSHLTDPVDLFPITVRSIRRQRVIKCARQRSLADTFDEMLEIVDQKIIEAELKGRPPERPPIVLERPPPLEKKEKQLEYFLFGLSPSTIQFRLGARLHRLLAKYRARKLKNDKRKEEWSAFNAKKPVPGVNDPEDEVELNHAKETIGDFKLKSARNYKVTKELRESTVKKYKQLLLIRQRQFILRNDYNKKTHDMRSRKVEVSKHVTKLNAELKDIHAEIHPKLRKFGPAPPLIAPEDFPEKNLEVRLPAAYRKTERQRIRRIVKPPKGDLLEKEVLTQFVLPKTGIPAILAKCHDHDSAWETEIREHRKSRKLQEQQLKIEEANKFIENFDDRIEELYREKLQITVDGDFLDIHLLTCHQELLILKEFEATEEQLQDKVHARLEELLDMQDIIDEINHRIDGHKIDIEQLQDTEKEIQGEFLAAASDNKFYDFLRRIFRRKYKPPKVRGPDDSSSSSSSSSSSEDTEEDAGSVDSRDFGIIKLDESVCPKGCDQRLYDYTFQLRTTRHGVELSMKEKAVLITQLKKELEVHFKQVKVINGHLKISQEELEAYQREKQRKLNGVRCAVVLKMHQLQHLNQNRCSNISDTLVFSQAALTKLYKRVGELHNETLLQKAKHKTNITHLCRMRTDCRNMEKTIAGLKAEIVEIMTIKFGQVVNIDELEEVQLKKMVFELRLSLIDVKGLFEDELKKWKRLYTVKQQELTESINDNTALLELLAVMNREKAELARLIANQAKKREHLENVVDVAEVYKEDIKRLSNILKKQNREIQSLREEIKRLNTKGLPPVKERPPLRRKPDEEEEREEELYQWQEWGYEAEEHIPQYISEEKGEGEEYFTPVPYPLTTEVQIPPVYPDEAEDIAKGLILEMLESLGSYDSMSKFVVEGLVEQILQGVLGRGSVIEIIENLIAFLPIEPTDEQQDIIETTAEQIFSMQETDSTTEDGWKSTATILNDILDEVMLTAGAPYDVICKLITQLVEQLPLDFLLKRDSINSIISKVQEQLPDQEIDKDELIQSVLSITSSRTDEIHQVLGKILEAVFGTGIDYLYYIKH